MGHEYHRRVFSQLFGRIYNLSIRYIEGTMSFSIHSPHALDAKHIYITEIRPSLESANTGSLTILRS